MTSKEIAGLRIYTRGITSDGLAAPTSIDDVEAAVHLIQIQFFDRDGVTLAGTSRVTDVAMSGLDFNSNSVIRPEVLFDLHTGPTEIGFLMGRVEIVYVLAGEVCVYPDGSPAPPLINEGGD